MTSKSQKPTRHEKSATKTCHLSMWTQAVNCCRNGNCMVLKLWKFRSCAFVDHRSFFRTNPLQLSDYERTSSWQWNKYRRKRSRTTKSCLIAAWFPSGYQTTAGPSCDFKTMKDKKEEIWNSNFNSAKTEAYEVSLPLWLTERTAVRIFGKISPVTTGYTSWQTKATGCAESSKIMRGAWPAARLKRRSGLSLTLAHCCSAWLSFRDQRKWRCPRRNRCCGWRSRGEEGCCCPRGFFHRRPVVCC